MQENFNLLKIIRSRLQDKSTVYYHQWEHKSNSDGWEPYFSAALVELQQNNRHVQRFPF
jgi:hypothetical protein